MFRTQIRGEGFVLICQDNMTFDEALDSAWRYSRPGQEVEVATGDGNVIVAAVIAYPHR